ncbi:hypothetical protein LX36DRAFT_653607 [Colletotrichum falcatum]|nr:hypothetical protein LX36DRAFT_653607 [Colletotrichum falcatum]
MVRGLFARTRNLAASDPRLWRRDSQALRCPSLSGTRGFRRCISDRRKSCTSAGAEYLFVRLCPESNRYSTSHTIAAVRCDLIEQQSSLVGNVTVSNVAVVLHYPLLVSFSSPLRSALATNLRIRSFLPVASGTPHDMWLEEALFLSGRLPTST